MAYKVTKHDVICWLEEQHDKWAGKFMAAEEKGNDDGMSDAEDKTNKIEELIDDIRDL